MLILFRLLFPATRTALAAAGLISGSLFGGHAGNGNVSVAQLLDTQNVTQGQLVETQNHSAGQLLEAQNLSAGQLLEVQGRTSGQLIEAQQRGRFEP
jgi:hypothetical protein